jgi:hypothetical protein
MGLAASHAAMGAPMQAVTEIGLGILLVIGLLTRPAAFVAFLYSKPPRQDCRPHIRDPQFALWMCGSQFC